MIKKLLAHSEDGKNQSQESTQESTQESNPESKPKSKYIDDPSCLSLSVREFLSTLNPEERNILMTTNSGREAADILKAHSFI